MNNWEYAESIESEKIVNIEKKYGHFIQGEFVSPKSFASPVDAMVT